jgi:NIPSNAP
MFIEHRTYSLKPGTLSQYFSTFGDRGFELHELMAPCLGWYYSEAGKLFEMTSLWHYDSFAQRLQRRANLFAMPEWRDLMARVQPLVNAIESRLVLPAPFWHGRTPTFSGLMPAGATAAGFASNAAIEANGVPLDVPFIEHRIYTLKPGATQRYLDLYGAEGLAIHETHAPCVGFYYTEAGALFQLISMWQFDSFEQRLERRATLNARADWKERFEAVSPFVERIESKFLMLAPFKVLSKRFKK